MPETDDLLPESPVPGLVPTLNHTGWMTVSLDEVSARFAREAGSLDGEVLDIGCAYGIASLAALEAGARVLACDMEPRHVDILRRRVPAALRDRLRTRVGTLPDVDFEPGSFAAILASRVLHFLRPEAVEQSVRKMHAWLEAGGRLYLVADSPYVGPWRGRAGEYERCKAAGDPWPGFIEDYGRWLPEGADPAVHPDFINPMDPDILARVCREAGLRILEARFLRGGTARSSERDHAGVIALRS